jgi:CRISPR-associated protein Cmr5
MQLMQQQRAQFALEAIEKAIKDGVNQKEYISYASSVPAMIHTNGLGQAAAFFKSKKGKNGNNKTTHEYLYQLLSDWLKKDNQPFANKDLLDGITNSDMQTYRLAQTEAQALMDWVKKFAKAYMKAETSEQLTN